MTTITEAGPREIDEVLAWLDHEHRLIEILAYRVDGLANMLRAGQHTMICQAASDVDDVQDQLAHASLRRDLAGLRLARRIGAAHMVRLSDIEQLADDTQRETAADLRRKIDDARATLAEAHERCRIAADAYRPEPR